MATVPTVTPKRIVRFIEPFRVRPGRKVSLAEDFDPASTGGRPREQAGENQELLQQGVALLAEYQDRLAAAGDDAVLVVLQAMDAAGKDGTIRHVMSGVNPQGVRVHGFKGPTPDELAHDYLWRYAARMPTRGEIAIFNRSYYEEVLVVRVHPALLAARGIAAGKGDGLWRLRYEHINNFERYLADNRVHVVKLFLNVSNGEQKRRFLGRIDEPDKNWKFTANDVRERDYWDDYQAAFSDVLSHTSTPWAPWYVVPADKKWFARILAAAVIANALIEIDPSYPKVSPQARQDLKAARRQLEGETNRSSRKHGKRARVAA
jgi:PPK2 family polyphosphate:nucleotide phosphotransferase